MNRGIPEMMMHCHNTSGGNSISAGAELTVLERQRSRIKWQQQGTVYNNMYSGLVQGGDQFQGGMCRDSGLQQVSIPMVKPESGLDIAWTGFSNYGMPSAENFESCGYVDASGIESSYERVESYQVVSVVGESSEGKDSNLTSKECGKKRRAERALKVASNDDTKYMKKIKEWDEDGESKFTQHSRSTNYKRKNKASEASGDLSKVSEVQKTDYIHVRARRGQATDSHSLAERVRREKISERMKYLQELVPGCNKITGKAGMLDEIINYVQSLQRQVEFLSMKLTTINPQLNFSSDSLVGKEVLTPSALSYGDPAYLRFSPLEEIISSGMDRGKYQLEIEQLPETYVETNSFDQNSSTWDAELQNLLAMELQGGSVLPMSAIYKSY